MKGRELPLDIIHNLSQQQTGSDNTDNRARWYHKIVIGIRNKKAVIVLNDNANRGSGKNENKYSY